MVITSVVVLEESPCPRRPFHKASSLATASNIFDDCT